MITARQLQLLRFVAVHIEAFGRAPGVNEIAAHMGIRSKYGVWCHVEALATKSLLKRGPFKTEHTLTVTPAGRLALANGGRLFRFLPERRCPCCGSATFSERCHGATEVA